MPGSVCAARFDFDQFACRAIVKSTQHRVVREPASAPKGTRHVADERSVGVVVVNVWLGDRGRPTHPQPDGSPPIRADYAGPVRPSITGAAILKPLSPQHLPNYGMHSHSGNESLAARHQMFEAVAFLLKISIKCGLIPHSF